MTSNSSFLSLLYYLGYPGAMVSWYGDETFQLFLLSHEMILDVAVVLMDKACQVAWLLKLLPAVGRNAIWQKQFNKRCMRNKKEPEHAHAQKSKSTKKSIHQRSPLQDEKKLNTTREGGRGKICLLLCLTDPKKLAGPKVKNLP